MALSDDYKKRLDSFAATRPEAYQSQYGQQIQNVQDRLNNRTFNYDYTQDSAYKDYEKQYKSAAERAGTNAQARAAARTGGYGNSFATTAGTEAYGGVMDGLNGVIVGLMEKALGSYNAETSELSNQLAGWQQAEQQSYNRYQQSVDDWYRQLNGLQGQYNTQLQNEQNDKNLKQQKSNNFWGTLGAIAGPLIMLAMSVL